MDTTGYRLKLLPTMMSATTLIRGFSFNFFLLFSSFPPFGFLLFLFLWPMFFRRTVNCTGHQRTADILLLFPFLILLWLFLWL